MVAEKTWEHPQLGRFVSDFDQWVREVDVPSFEAFTFDEFGRRTGTSRVMLRFPWVEVDDDEEPPTPSRRAVNVALRTLENHEQLADRIRNGVLKDLRGRGRETGMWWHGDLTTIAEQFEHAFPQRSLRLDQPEDVNDLIGNPQIRIYESVYRHDQPVAVVGFDAVFDVEHGLGVLTDGRRVLGIGYRGDPMPYRS